MHTISSFLHPSTFPLIPPPPPLLHLKGFPFLCFSALLTRERRRKRFSLFPFLPFPTTLLPSVSAPFLPSFLPPLFTPSFTSPLSSPSLLTLFLFLLSFLHLLLSKFVKATPSPFHRFLFITFSLSLCLFIFRSPTPPPPLYFTHPSQKKNLTNKTKKEQKKET